MTARAMMRLLAGYVVLAVVIFFVVRAHATLDPVTNGAVVESQWSAGKLVGRRVLGAGAGAAGAGVVLEHVVAEAPLSSRPTLLSFALVPGRDGVRGELGGKTAFVTVDDLLAEQAYDHGTSFFDASLGIGTPPSLIFFLLAQRLGTTADDVAKNARLTRVRFERTVSGKAPRPRIGPHDVTRELVTDAVRQAAWYLARSVDDSGRFRYVVNATTNTEIPGYSWPRHAGATYFLVQAAELLDDPHVRYAALRAAAKMRDETMVDCGEYRCIAGDDEADVGSSALGLLAFTEIVRTGADPAYRRPIGELTKFLRAQQRADGELMHLYRRSEKRPIDVQLLYYTGEAALALARAHTITGDPRDLDASKRALGHLVGAGWSFFGSRYYFSEEHWTCQTMADLWERAPSEEALAFCERWHEYQRRIQHEDGDSPFDADGAFGFGPMMSPRLTPASSRGEAAGATLEVVRKRAGQRHDPRADALEDELVRAIAFVLREQFRTNSSAPSHLFADPEAVSGAMPGSPVDWQLRIDYPQHAGSMMIRWLSLTRP